MYVQQSTLHLRNYFKGKAITEMDKKGATVRLKILEDSCYFVKSMSSNVLRLFYAIIWDRIEYMFGGGSGNPPSSNKLSLTI